MSKFCSNCGTELKEGVKFCEKCGSPVKDENKQKVYSGAEPVVTNRNIGLAIVLSFITCGIYAIIWMVSINDDVNVVSEDTSGMSGAMVFILTLITCGIYGIYWNYKMGQKLYEANGKYDKGINDNSIVYLILSICGLSIISYCLMQSDLNKFS